MKKVAALFLDAENLYFTQKNGWPIDFERLYEFFAQHYSIYNAFYYTVVDPSNEENYEEKNQFLDALAFEGYTVRRKLVKLIRTGDKVMRKGNVDIEMVVDMFNTRDLYDVVILFSGDSDFERALELLRTYGKEVLVVSAKGSVARELINAADKYIDLEVIKEEIAAKPNGVDKMLTVMPKLRPMVQPAPAVAPIAAQPAPKDVSPINTRVGSRRRRRPQKSAAVVAPAENTAAPTLAPIPAPAPAPTPTPAHADAPARRAPRRRIRRSSSAVAAPKRDALVDGITPEIKVHTEKYRVQEG